MKTRSLPLDPDAAPEEADQVFKLRKELLARGKFDLQWVAISTLTPSSFNLPTAVSHDIDPPNLKFFLHCWQRRAVGRRSRKSKGSVALHKRQHPYEPSSIRLSAARIS
jgi:hypothetical protein